jgi:hypothetical protein
MSSRAKHPNRCAQTVGVTGEPLLLAGVTLGRNKQLKRESKDLHFPLKLRSGPRPRPPDHQSPWRSHRLLNRPTPRAAQPKSASPSPNAASRSEPAHRQGPPEEAILAHMRCRAAARRQKPRPSGRGKSPRQKGLQPRASNNTAAIRKSERAVSRRRREDMPATAPNSEIRLLGRRG